MGASRLGVTVTFAVLAAGAVAPGVRAQQAQYTKDDVIKAFSKPPADAPPAAAMAVGGGCPDGTALGDDGVCEPVMHTRGFNLVDPKRMAAAPRPATTRTPAVRHAPRPAARLASAAVSSGDLLINFRTASADLTSQDRANIKVFAAALDSPTLAGARFEISGHTDSRGAPARNMALSQARADAVRGQLIQDGVDGSRLTAKGYGAVQPVASLAPDAPANRRVEARRLDVAG